jgi:hypothetical protein
MTLIETARKYIGQKEMTGNKFIDDPKVKGDLGERIKAAGQKDGEAWCAYFVEAVLRETYPDRSSEIDKYISASAVKTFENLKKAGYKVSKLPTVGDIVVWQKYKEGKPIWQGHIGIVSKVINGNVFMSIEGNTNNGKSREGTTVLENRHTCSVLTNGLNVMGFVTF